MNRLAIWIAELGPIGRAKYMPGTLGSIAAIPLLLVIQKSPGLLYPVYAFFLVVGIWASEQAAKAFNLKDPGSVIIDEVCGMLTVFLFNPLTWPSLVIGFICFRFFDILKVPPVNFLEKVPGGLGIVLDDVGAGLYGALVLHLILSYAKF